MTDSYVTVTQSMKVFHVTRPTILRWIHNKRLDGCKFINSKWLIPESSINKFLNTKPPKKAPINNLDRLDNWFMELKRSYHPRRVNNQLTTAYSIFIRTMRIASVGHVGQSIFNAQLEQQLIFYHSIEKLRDSQKWANNAGKYLPGFGNFLQYVIWQQKEDPSILRKYLRDKEDKVDILSMENATESEASLYDIKL